MIAPLAKLYRADRGVLVQANPATFPNEPSGPATDELATIESQAVRDTPPTWPGMLATLTADVPRSTSSEPDEGGCDGVTCPDASRPRCAASHAFRRRNACRLGRELKPSASD